MNICQKNERIWSGIGLIALLLKLEMCINLVSGKEFDTCCPWSDLSFAGVFGWSVCLI